MMSVHIEFEHETTLIWFAINPTPIRFDCFDKTYHPGDVYTFDKLVKIPYIPLNRAVVLGSFTGVYASMDGYRAAIRFAYAASRAGNSGSSRLVYGGPLP